MLKIKNKNLKLCQEIHKNYKLYKMKQETNVPYNKVHVIIIAIMKNRNKISLIYEHIIYTYIYYK